MVQLVGCVNASDCTAEIQAALDDASGRRLLFRGARRTFPPDFYYEIASTCKTEKLSWGAGTYVTTPLVLRANHTVLQFAPGSLLLAKRCARVCVCVRVCARARVCVSVCRTVPCPAQLVIQTG